MPLHPFIVHFPIVLPFVAAVLYLVWVRSNGQPWLFALLICLGVSLLAAAAAVISGQTAADIAVIANSATTTFDRHQNFAYATLTLNFVLVAWLSQRHKIMKKAEQYAFGCGIAVLIGLVIATGFAGGEMVYEHGVGVSKERISP